MNNLNYFTKISASCAALALMTLAGCASHKPIDYAPTQVESANQAEAWELQGKLRGILRVEICYLQRYYTFHIALLSPKDRLPLAAPIALTPFALLSRRLPDFTSHKTLAES